MREETDWLGSDQFLPDGKFPSDSSEIKPPKGDWEKLRILQSFLKNIRVASEKVQETVVVTYVYIPAEAAEVLEIVKKRPEELIITLAEEVLGRECDEVKQTFSGTIMPDEVADLFKVPHGTAALKIIRNYMDVRGRTIVASESFHTADRFSFSVAVKKKKY